MMGFRLGSACSDPHRTAQTLNKGLPPQSLQRSPNCPLLALPLSWIRRVLPSLACLIRTALSWKYALSCLAVLYTLLHLVRGQRLLASTLPDEYTGPHDVGVIDLEYPLEKPRRVSSTVLKSTGLPAFEIKTILLKLYYPAKRGSPETRPRHSWISGPIGLRAEGYAKFLGTSSFITRHVLTFILWAVAGSITIPAKVDAPLLVLSPSESDQSPAAACLSDFNDQGERADGFPVMVFSHGDTSCRNEYTSFASELASRGYVIAVLEHRDGSSANTVIKMHGRQDQNLTHFHHRDLVSARDLPVDRLRWKAEQLAMRDAEIAEAVRILRAINNGTGRSVFASNTRHEGHLLYLWKGRLDLSRLVLGGHSFGATSALQALRHKHPAHPFVGGVILDPGKASGPLNTDLRVPILVLHSDSWSRTHSIFHGRPHFDTVRDLAEGVRRRARAAWFLTSRGTSHATVSDFPLILPLALGFITGARTDARAAMREYVRVTHEFCLLLRHRGEDGAAQIQAEEGSLLAQSVTHREYGRWISGDGQMECERECTGGLGWQIHVSPASGEQEDGPPDAKTGLD